MKTLGDTGLLPEKILHGKEYILGKDWAKGHNRTITEISAIPLLTVVRKAVEGGLIKIKKCPNKECHNSEYKYLCCQTCNGTGFVIEERNE